VFLRTIHLLAAMTWAGGMVFFSLVLMPSVRRAVPPPDRPGLIRAVGRRYRFVGWAGIAVLLITGPLMAWDRGVDWDSEFGRLLALKLTLVGAMLVLTLFHDLVLGPRVTRDPAGSDRLRPMVAWLARLNLLVVLAIVVCGVWLTAV
jgi:putative copper export protein